MKKIFIVAFVAMLCIVMLVPVNAQTNNDKYNFYGDEYLTDWAFFTETEQFHLHELLEYYPQMHALIEDSLYTDPTLYVAESQSVDAEFNIVLTNVRRLIYDYDIETWVLKESPETYTIEARFVDWTYKDIVDNNGNQILKGNPTVFEPQCDGSSCPATDANFDNVCDDCGSVLTMSLRSTLYDYAVDYTDRYVNNEEQYTYRIIVQDNDNRYSVYLSTTPAVYNSTTNELTFTDGKQTYVTQESDGTNKGDGWAILTTVSNALTLRGNIVYANYDIENFFPIPLWEEMDNLTQGEMETLLPNLGGVMMILALCGVGCLALVIVLNLFGKRSLISRN